MPYKIKQINEQAIHDWLSSHEKDIARVLAYMDNKNFKYNGKMIRVEESNYVRVSCYKLAVDIYSFNQPMKLTLEQEAIRLVDLGLANTNCFFIPMQSWELLVIDQDTIFRTI